MYLELDGRSPFPPLPLVIPRSAKVDAVVSPDRVAPRLVPGSRAPLRFLRLAQQLAGLALGARPDLAGLALPSMSHGSSSSARARGEL